MGLTSILGGYSAILLSLVLHIVLCKVLVKCNDPVMMQDPVWFYEDTSIENLEIVFM